MTKVELLRLPYECRAECAATGGKVIWVDSRLVSLTVAAAQGAQCPMVSLMVGPWIVQGKPVSDGVFQGRTLDRLAHIQLNATPRRDVRVLQKSGGEDAVRQMMMTSVSPLVAALGDEQNGDGSINLVDVSAYSGVGTVTVLAVRVPLHAVGMWWITDFQHEPMKVTGGGGVSFSF